MSRIHPHALSLLPAKRAYEFAAPIRFDGMQLRHDIGYRAIRC